MGFIRKLLVLCVVIQVATSEVEDLDVIFTDEYNVARQKWNFLSLVLGHFGAPDFHSSSDSAEIFPYDLIEEDDQVANDLYFSPEGHPKMKCGRDLFYIAQNYKKPWAWQYIDSFGKIESGLLKGNVHWLGEYDECMSAYAPPKMNSSTGNVHGKYCQLQIQFNTSNSQNLMLNQLKAIAIGVCIPESCSASSLNKDFAAILKYSTIMPYIKKYASMLNNITVTCLATSKQLNAPAIGVISLMCIFGALALCGSLITVWEYMKNIYRTPYYSPFNSISNDISIIKTESDGQLETKNYSSNNDVPLLGVNDSGWLENLKAFFQCFCVFKNGAKILNTNATEGQLLSIHGIRFLSMTWVILGHTYIFGYANIRNPIDLFKLKDDFAFQIVLQGFFSVDSFFVLSGFLLTYLFLNEIIKRNGRISWAYFYIHRFVRLTPIYMIVLGFYATLYRYFLYGPFSPDGTIDPGCQKSWWWNLLYINNFLSSADQCMGWAWYLANDMQFYVISPLILYSLWRIRSIGLSLIGILLFGCWCANFVITYHFDLVTGIATFPHNIDASKFMLIFSDYFEKLYIKPYARISPYLVGMLTGYILLKMKQNKQRINKIYLTVGWIIATAITLTCVYGLYHANPSLIATSFYNALSRMTFAIGLCWVIFVCLTGYGGVVNKILSFKLFIPLSRLTYSAYLVHPMILMGYYGTIKTTLYFTHFTMVTLFLGFLVITYGFAFLTTLIFESPIMALEKLIMKKFSKVQ